MVTIRIKGGLGNQLFQYAAGYVLNLRITKAKQMLRFTDKKLEDIGYQCGLGAPHYFSRIFKQVEGITPSEFREKW